MSLFNRELRYTVTKNKTGQAVNAVVVEEGWPEYEIVWGMIQDRVEGRLSIIESLKLRLAEKEAELKLMKQSRDEWRQESDNKKAECEGLKPYKAFVDWFDLYGVSINTVADERGSYRLDWHRGEAFGNTMRELIAAVDAAIAAREKP